MNLPSSVDDFFCFVNFHWTETNWFNCAIVTFFANFFLPFYFINPSYPSLSLVYSQLFFSFCHQIASVPNCVVSLDPFGAHRINNRLDDQKTSEVSCELFSDFFTLFFSERFPSIAKQIVTTRNMMSRQSVTTVTMWVLHSVNGYCASYVDSHRIQKRSESGVNFIWMHYKWRKLCSDEMMSWTDVDNKLLTVLMIFHYRPRNADRSNGATYFVVIIHLAGKMPKRSWRIRDDCCCLHSSFLLYFSLNSLLKS